MFVYCYECMAEGTRIPDADPGVTLKTGMMRVAFRMNIPVQVTHVSNKEHIMREKPWYLAHWGVTCTTMHAPVIKPSSFKSDQEDLFVEAIKTAWITTAEKLRTIDAKEHEPVALWHADLNLKAGLLFAVTAILAYISYLFAFFRLFSSSFFQTAYQSLINAFAHALSLSLILSQLPPAYSLLIHMLFVSVLNHSSLPLRIPTWFWSIAGIWVCYYGWVVWRDLPRTSKSDVGGAATKSSSPVAVSNKKA